MRILVCGSRQWDGTWEDIAAHLPDESAEDVTIIHGACSRKVTRVYNGRTFHNVEVSVDMLADFAARGLGFNVVPFPADWSLGAKAGSMRNEHMLRDGKPDRGLAFGALWKINDSPRGKPWKLTGTGGMVSLMLAAGVPVRWLPAPRWNVHDLVTMPQSPSERAGVIIDNGVPRPA